MCARPACRCVSQPCRLLTLSRVAVLGRHVPVARCRRRRRSQVVAAAVGHHQTLTAAVRRVQVRRRHGRVHQRTARDSRRWRRHRHRGRRRRRRRQSHVLAEAGWQIASRLRCLGRPTAAHAAAAAMRRAQVAHCGTAPFTCQTTYKHRAKKRHGQPKQICLTHRIERSIGERHEDKS